MPELPIKLPATAALSLLVHAGALAWIVTRDEPPQRVAAIAPRAELPPASSEPANAPLEIVLLDDHTAAVVTHERDAMPVPRDVAATRARAPASGRLPAERASADRASADRAPADRGAATATPALAATSATTTERPAQRDTPPPARPSLLTMRHGPDIGSTIHRPGSEGISDRDLAKMVRGDIPVPIANLPGAQASADLQRANDRLHDPRFVEGATPDELTALRQERARARDALASTELVARNDGTYTSDKTTFRATVRPDGSVRIADKPNWQWQGLGATFDVTDAFMRSHGQDPYAAEKLRYLDRTRDQRVEIGKRYRTAQLASSAQLMAANLGRLWATVTDPAERKRELFALWDECAETGDDEVIAGGAAARRVVINFIHAKRITFTPAELAALAARKQSRATFAP